MISLALSSVNLVYVGDWGISNSIEKDSGNHDIVALELGWANKGFMEGDNIILF